MKQHITVQQWNELTEEQKQKIIPWVIGSGNLKEKHYSRYFNIGKMIEILGNKINGISLPYDGIGCEVFLYEVKSISKDSLCDALWEAVKKAIE